jgi:hypothetical protein
MDHQPISTSELIRSVLDDARELIREELAVARAEIRSEVSTARTVGIAFGAAAVAGLIALALFAVALGGGIADLFGWPPWAGYGVTALLLSGAAYAAIHYAQTQLARLRALPKTTETLRENMAWIQQKSTSSKLNSR